MSRLRIVCKAPWDKDGRFLAVPTWHDVALSLVDDDGAEHPIDNVSAVTWRCSSEGDWAATATLEFVDVEVDLDAPAEAFTREPWGRSDGHDL